MDVKRVTRVEGSNPAGRVLDSFTNEIKEVIKEPAGSLKIGYLIDQRRTLPDDLVTSLQVAGLTHVVVASRYNLTILIRLCQRLFMEVSRFLALFSSVALVAAFIEVMGISPSMSRAGPVTGCRWRLDIMAVSSIRSYSSVSPRRQRHSLSLVMAGVVSGGNYSLRPLQEL